MSQSASRTAGKPFALFNAYPDRVTTPAYLAACGANTFEMFRAAAGLSAADLLDIDIEHAETLPDPRDLAGVIVSGSGTMVTDRLPWAERAAGWIRAHRADLPILGVCFGHQLVAHALGGTIDWTPNGPEYTTIAVTQTAAGRDDPLFRGLPATFAAQAAHHQSVMVPPAGSTVLATSHACIEALHHGARCWGVQFHPEMDARTNTAILDHFGANLARDGLDLAAARAAIADSTLSLHIVRNFVSVAART